MFTRGKGGLLSLRTWRFVVAPESERERDGLDELNDVFWRFSQIVAEAVLIWR